MKRKTLLILLLALSLTGSVWGAWCPYNPGSAVPSAGQKYFRMESCPYCSAKDVFHNHVLEKHVGEVVDGTAFVSPGVGNVLNNGSGNLDSLTLHLGVRVHDYAFRSQYISDWAYFSPVKFSAKWVVTAAANGRTKEYEIEDTYSVNAHYYAEADNRSNHIDKRVDEFTKNMKVDLNELLSALGMVNSGGEIRFSTQVTVVCTAYTEGQNDGSGCAAGNWLTSHTANGQSGAAYGTIPSRLTVNYSVEKFAISLSDYNAVGNASGNGDHTLVYNHPNAEILFNVAGGASNNLPADRTLGNPRVSVNAYLAFFASPNSNVWSSGVNAEPFSAWPVEWRKAWMGYFSADGSSTGHLSSVSERMTRSKDLVLNTNGSDLSGDYPFMEWNESIVPIPDSGTVSVRRRLSDFTRNDYRYGNGSVIYVGGRVIYAPSSAAVFQEPYLLSFHSSNNGLLSNLKSENTYTVLANENPYELISSVNTVSFEIVPEVSFPALTDEEKKIRRVCVSDEVRSERDFIHLRGKSLQVQTGYSETVYQPTYIWEYSADGKHWNDIEATNFTFDPSELSFVTNYGAHDAFVSSDLLQNFDSLLFRQSVVLGAFCSDQKSAGDENDPLTLYRHEGWTPRPDGTHRYYAVVSSADHYTYKKNPATATIGNFQFDYLPSPDGKSLEMHVCRTGEDQYEEYPIAFSLIPSNNLQGEAYEQVKSIASYSISNPGETREDRKVTILSNTGYVSFYGDEAVWECTISVCNNDYTKTFTIHPVDIPSVRVKGESVSTQYATYFGDLAVMDAYLAGRDTLNVPNTAYLTAAKGKKVKVEIANADEEAGVVYKSRAVVPFVHPSLAATDFSAMTRTECLAYCEEHGWDVVEGFGGIDMEEVGVSALRGWMQAQQNQENDALRTAAEDAFVQANAWREMSSNQALVSTSLEAYSDSVERAVFFLKKENAYGCVGDSTRVEILYTNPLSDNSIRFENGEMTAWISSDGHNPLIVGSLPDGGFGRPDAANGTSYTFDWYYRVKGSFQGWRKLPGVESVTITDADDLSPATVGVYLPKGIISGADMWPENLDSKVIYVKRLVTSRRGNGVGAVVADSSNTLVISVPATIDASWFSLLVTESLEDETGYKFSGALCPGQCLYIGGVNGLEGSFYRNIHCDVVEGEAVVDTTTFPRLRGPNIYGFSDDFSVECYYYGEENGQTVRTNACTLRIPVRRLVADFDVLVGGSALYGKDEAISAHAGQRIRLINRCESDSALSFEWVLQTQKIGYNTVYGTRSRLENPACYLYNNGDNRVSLNVSSGNGCTASVSAVIAVTGQSSLRTAPAVFVSDEGEEEDFSAEETAGGRFVRVFPTVVRGEDVRVVTSDVGYSVQVTDLTGRTLYRAEGLSGESLVPASGFHPGTYIVRAAGESRKFIVKK